MGINDTAVCKCGSQLSSSVVGKCVLRHSSAQTQASTNCRVWIIRSEQFSLPTGLVPASLLSTIYGSLGTCFVWAQAGCLYWGHAFSLGPWMKEEWCVTNTKRAEMGVAGKLIISSPEIRPFIAITNYVTTLHSHLYRSMPPKCSSFSLLSFFLFKIKY